MTETRPKCDPEAVYMVKRACAELGVSYKTLRNLRRAGYIAPVNPDNIHRMKYTGQAILDCWDKLSRI